MGGSRLPTRETVPNTSGALGSLSGVRVIELADEQAEYCGLLLSGLGAEVIKIEPPGGSPTRRIGPFLEDQPHPERSLYFWQYNRGKRSIQLDLGRHDDVDTMRSLLNSADVVLDSTPKGYLEGCGLGLDRARQQAPSLITARISP